MAGPLEGLRVVELGGIGPSPFAGMLLADMGADVVRVARPSGAAAVAVEGDPTLRGRVSAIEQRLNTNLRPGVMERLGLGPDELLARNPRLVYGRMTGYGQDGPLASVAGHDINYISIAGVLGASRRAGDRPMFPLNLVGDYGGGGMLLALGVVSAVLHARGSGRGQVVDAAMVEGASQLATLIHGLHAGGVWSDEPGTNMLDSGAHFYNVYATSDGRHLAVGAIEPQFYAELLRLLELPAEELPQWDRERWPEFKARLADVFRTRTRADWTEIFEHADACVTPVLGLFEASRHPHNVARGAFTELDGATVPAPAPRFGATPAGPAPSVAISPAEALERWG